MLQLSNTIIFQYYAHAIQKKKKKKKKVARLMKSVCQFFAVLHLTNATVDLLLYNEALFKARHMA